MVFFVGPFSSQTAFLRSGTALGGTVSNTSLLNPSKPFLLFATLVINNTPLHTLIDTAAFATYISIKALQRTSNFRYVDETSRSFALADGVIPLMIKDRMELSMQFGNEFTNFYALVTGICIMAFGILSLVLFSITLATFPSLSLGNLRSWIFRTCTICQLCPPCESHLNVSPKWERRENLNNFNSNCITHKTQGIS
jgi:hypothetical protein